MSQRAVEFERVTRVDGPGEYRIARDPHPLNPTERARHVRMTDFSNPQDAIEGYVPEWYQGIPSALKEAHFVVGIRAEFRTRVNGHGVDPQDIQEYWDGQRSATLAIRAVRTNPIFRDHAYLEMNGPFLDPDRKISSGTIQLADMKGFVTESPRGVLHRDTATRGGILTLEYAQREDALGDELPLWKTRLNMMGRPGALLVTAIQHFNETVASQKLPLWKELQKD